MNSLESESHPAQSTTAETPKPPKIPRLDSLLHRLQRARDAEGKPLELLADLMFFLQDPPEGTHDRWQKGADLCAAHGIATSRMAVWRLYRSHARPWRYEQNPALPEPDPEATARLQAQARHLAAARALEMLQDPDLSPGHLIGLMQALNHQQKVEIAGDQLDHRIDVQKYREDQDRREAEKQRRSEVGLAPIYAALFERLGQDLHTGS